jgi:hypothetical protein
VGLQHAVSNLHMCRYIVQLCQYSMMRNGHHY